MTWLTFILAGAVLAPRAGAQLAPDRLYYGIDRAMPMTVKIPDGKTGEATIQLLRPVTAEKAKEASVLAGPVNMATLFPELWTNKTPTVLYAQLVVGGEKIGPAVVLQPLASAKMARPGQGKPMFTAMGDQYSGIRAYVDKHVVLTTDKGEMEFRLRPDQAPNNAWNFRSLVEGGFYTDVMFHRIIGPQGGKPGFMVQTGDPTGTGAGGPGYFVDLEDSKLPHDVGVLSMARSGDPNSAGAQFFICLSRQGTSFLDGAYTAFGEAVRGQDTLTALGAHPVGPSGSGEMSAPAKPEPRIVSAKLVDAPPYGTGPKALSEQAKSGAETKPAAAPQAVETKPADAKAADGKPGEGKPGDNKPVEGGIPPSGQR